MPFWTSYVVRSFVWLPILGTNGAINRFLLWLGIIDQPLTGLLYNEGAIYVGLVYVYTLFMALPIYLSIEKIDPRLIEAASDLGARPLWIFLRIILPLSWPGVLSGCVMVFLLAMSSLCHATASRRAVRHHGQRHGRGAVPGQQQLVPGRGAGARPVVNHLYCTHGRGPVGRHTPNLHRRTE